MQLKNIDDRSKLLLDNKFDLIKHKKIAIIGLGGVGSIIPISLVRSGFKNLLLIDFDLVDETNLNRQIAYTINDIGYNKTDCLKKYLECLNINSNIKTLNKKIDDNFEFNILNDYDYVCDCIDDINGKVNLIRYCLNNNIKIISSLGMGNRLDPSKVLITKLNKTTGDPLAKKLRYLLKKNDVDIKNLDVVFSKEEPLKKDKIISSMVFVPNSAGLLMSYYILNDIIKGAHYETSKN